MCAALKMHGVELGIFSIKQRSIISSLLFYSNVNITVRQYSQCNHRWHKQMKVYWHLVFISDRLTWLWVMYNLQLYHFFLDKHTKGMDLSGDLTITDPDPWVMTLVQWISLSHSALPASAVQIYKLCRQWCGLSPGVIWRHNSLC